MDLSKRQDGTYSILRKDGTIMLVSAYRGGAVAWALLSEVVDSMTRRGFEYEP